MSLSAQHKQGRGNQEPGQKWVCPICGKLFKSEVEKDTHMTVDCKQHEAAEREHNSVGNRSDAGKEKSNSKGGSLPRKQPVQLAWVKQVQTCEREIYFFNKSGDMFVLKQPEQSSSGSGKARFECLCEMEVGEQEGSLNISDNGVHEVQPFSIKRQEGNPLQVLLKTAGADTHKAGTDRLRGQPIPDKYLQTGAGKLTSKELEKHKTEIGNLKKKHEAEREELLKREEKHKQTISQLKGRLADKEKTLPYRDENLKSLEEEMGRFSEKSHAVFDKYSEDKSKFDESETLLAGVRLELQGQKALVAKLQTGNQDLEEKKANLVREQMQLESEITASRSQMESLSGNSSFTRNESEKKHRSTNTQSAETEVSLLKARSAELERELAMRVQLIEQLSKGPAESEYEMLRNNYFQLENELIQLKQRGAAAPNSFKSEIQSRITHSEVATREKRAWQEEVDELKLELTLKTSECDDLNKKVTSLGSELREARDLLASKLYLMGEIEEKETERDVCGLSVSQSLGAEFKRSDLGVNTQQPTGPAIKRQHSDTIDVDRVRQLEKQLQQLQLQLSDAKNNIKILQNVCGEKMLENNILRENLDTSRKELETTKLELLGLSVLSKPDSMYQSAGNASQIQDNKVTSVKEKQPGSPKTAVNPIQQHKYKITNLYFEGKYAKFYSLDQVENPETLIQELAVCTPKGSIRHVIGTIRVIIRGRYKYKDTTVGIEFLDPLGDSNGEYKFTRYFDTKYNHAVFLPINEVYVSYHDQMKSDV